MDTRCKNRILIKLILVIMLWGAVAFATSPRIVSIAPNISEIMYYLDLQDNLVGVTAEADYPKDVELKPVVGSFFSPDLESIVKLKPDYVVTSADPPQPVFLRLKELGIKVKNYHISDFNSLLKTMRELSLLCNNQKNRSYEEFCQKLSGLKNVESSGKKAVILYWLEPPMSAGNKSFLNEVITYSGLSNIFGNVDKAYINVDIETLINKSPEVIIFAGMQDKMKIPNVFKEYIKATSARVIYFENPDIVLRSGPRLIDAVEYLRGNINEK